MINTIKNAEEKLVVALGFFDSVHKAHQRIIGKTIELAQILSATPTLFTFSNNPYIYFNKSGKLFYSYSKRISLINNYGIKNIISYEFNQTFADLSAEDFFKLLTTRYNIAGIVAGYDYTFGKNGLGNFELLKKLCDSKGITCEVVDKIEIDGIKVGTTAIKEFLLNGEFDRAYAMLNRPYSIEGKVSRGRGDGKTYQHPTLNISLPDLFLPCDGVYATKTIIDGKSYKSVSNLGPQPTYEMAGKNLETHIIDSEGDFYGKEIKVEFYCFLRKIVKFYDKRALHEQISQDISRAKEILL